MSTTQLVPLYELANVIARECRGKDWFYYAKPYVEALACLTTVEDNYYYDTGDTIVLYTLSNLQSWRGETARSVKLELKKHLKK